MNDRPERTGRIIGFDVGTRRVGVAISDELGIIATPIETLHIPLGMSNQTTAEKLTNFARQHGVTRIVVGLPRNMKGERGVQAQWTEEIVRMLRQSLREDHIPVAVYDERLTSVAAQAAMGERTPRHRRGSKEESGARSIDARAATLILQGYLDRRRARREEPVDAEEDNP